MVVVQERLADQVAEVVVQEQLAKEMPAAATCQVQVAEVVVQAQ